jgi:hypothetical protein
MLRSMSSRGPRIGIWGTFDVADYGDLIAPRIFEHELRRRLPHASVYPYAPLGAEHPIGMDSGRPATPLGSWTPARRAQLAEQFDLVVVAGNDVIHVRDDLHRNAYADAAPEAVGELEPSRFFGDGLGAEKEQRCPVVWHAVGVRSELAAEAAKRVRAALASKRYVSVDGPTSRERLLATGTEQEIALVPDPSILVSRLFPAQTISKRVGYLRAVESYPIEERPLVLQVSATIAPYLEQVASAASEAAQRHPGLPIVVVALAPARGDAEVADGLASRIAGPVYRLPSELTTEDLVAAIANARAFVGSSPPGYLTALAFGVPGALIGTEDPSIVEGFGAWGAEQAVIAPSELGGAIDALLRADAAVDMRSVQALADAVDEHFDTLATIAEASWSERLAESDPAGDAAADLARSLTEAERRHDALLRAYATRGERLLRERLRLAEILDAMEAEKTADAAFQTLLELAETRNRLDIRNAEASAARFERDQALAELEQVRAERDELRRQLAGEHRPPHVRRLLPRRA